MIGAEKEQMNETTIAKIEDYSEKVCQRIYQLVFDEKNDLATDTFHTKLLKNCEEMRHLSLDTLTPAELGTILRYWQMMDSLTVNEK